MISFHGTTPPPFRRPYSVIQADANFRRQDTMPPERLTRVVARVLDAIADTQLTRMREAEGAELAYCGICGCTPHIDCGACA